MKLFGELQSQAGGGMSLLCLLGPSWCPWGCSVPGIGDASSALGLAWHMLLVRAMKCRRKTSLPCTQSNGFHLLFLFLVSTAVTIFLEYFTSGF